MTPAIPGFSTNNPLDDQILSNEILNLFKKINQNVDDGIAKLQSTADKLTASKPHGLDIDEKNLSPLESMFKKYLGIKPEVKDPVVEQLKIVSDLQELQTQLLNDKLSEQIKNQEAEAKAAEATKPKQLDNIFYEKLGGKFQDVQKSLLEKTTAMLNKGGEKNIPGAKWFGELFQTYGERNKLLAKKTETPITAESEVATPPVEAKVVAKTESKETTDERKDSKVKREKTVSTLDDIKKLLKDIFEAIDISQEESDMANEGKNKDANNILQKTADSKQKDVIKETSTGKGGGIFDMLTDMIGGKLLGKLGPMLLRAAPMLGTAALVAGTAYAGYKAGGAINEFGNKLMPGDVEGKVTGKTDFNDVLVRSSGAGQFMLATGLGATSKDVAKAGQQTEIDAARANARLEQVKATGKGSAARAKVFQRQALYDSIGINDNKEKERLDKLNEVEFQKEIDTKYGNKWFGAGTKAKAALETYKTQTAKSVKTEVAEAEKDEKAKAESVVTAKATPTTTPEAVVPGKETPNSAMAEKEKEKAVEKAGPLREQENAQSQQLKNVVDELKNVGKIFKDKDLNVSTYVIKNESYAYNNQPTVYSGTSLGR